MVLLGVLCIAGAAWLEDRMLAQCPWRHALVCPDGAPPWEGTLPLRARRIPEENRPPDGPLMAQVRQDPQGPELLESLGLDRMEYVFMVPLPPDVADGLVASGRMPEPGKPEVLAGSLARFDTFEMDGVTFSVTGRLHPGVSAFQTSYLMPDTEKGGHFSLKAGGTGGWIAPEGMMKLDTAEWPDDQEDPPALLAGGGRAQVGCTLWAMAGLALVAGGGALLQVRLLKKLAGQSVGILSPILQEITQRPGLLWGVHGLCYGLFFVSMAGALAYPGAGLRLLQYTRGLFTDGGLDYIGRAYDSGNILWAAAATFAHNYLMATCLFSILPSLFVPFAGLLKNLLSFSVVGFAMSPMWAGSAAPYTYHSITLTLELEAYIITSFMVSALPLRVLRSFGKSNPAIEYVAGLKCIGSGTLLVGIMLAIAALYEAATLILFRG